MVKYNHAKLLATYLELGTRALDAPAETKRIVNTRIPRELSYQLDDGKVVNARELLQTEKVNNTPLIITEMYGTLIQGAEPVKIMRQAVPIFRTNSNVLRVPLGAAGSYASQVMEGAEIPIEVQAYSNADFTINKFGVRPLITNELIEDSRYDVIALEVMKAGAKLENKLNQDMLYTLISNAYGAVTDSIGTNPSPLKALAKAIAQVQTNNFMADTVVMSPAMYGAILGQMTGVFTNTGDQAIKEGNINPLFGKKVFITGVSPGTLTTYTAGWGYGTNLNCGAIVFDSANAGAIAMNRDLRLVKYDDPIRDLVGCSCTMRYGVNYLFSGATEVVEQVT